MEKGVANLMSDKRLARRAVLKLKFENVDVPEDIALHLVSASYTDNEDGSTDDFQIVYEDRERNLLGDWLEVKPTIIKTEKQVAKEVQKEEVINYVVKRGDTLWDIASQYLTSGTKYSQIVQENKYTKSRFDLSGTGFQDYDRRHGKKYGG